MTSATGFHCRQPHQGSIARSTERVFHFSAARQSRHLRHLIGVMLVVVALVLPGSWGARAADDRAALRHGVAWLATQQAESGAFIGYTGEEDASTTIQALLAIVSAQRAGVDADPAAAWAWLEANALVITQAGPGMAAQLALAAIAMGQDPHDIGTVDPLAIVSHELAKDGIMGNGVYEHALGVMALAAAGDPVPEDAIQVLLDTQADNGMWAYDGTNDVALADTNTTSIVLQALLAAGHGSDVEVAEAVDGMLALRTDTGGFPYQAGMAEDANSTALVIQVVLAIRPGALGTPEEAISPLLAYQNPSGAFGFMADAPDDNLFSTIQAVITLSGELYPVGAAPTPTAAG